jgi:hypothetical protein
MVSTAVSVHERTPTMPLLIRRRRPIAEPAGDHATLTGTAGAGRIVLALAELGIDLGDLDQLVVDPAATAADIDRIRVAAAYPLVVLGSHLVNRPEPGIRGSLINLAKRHLGPHARLLLEHHPIDWVESVGEVQPTPGGAPGMLEVRRHAPFVSAVSVYDVGGHEVRQPFTAQVLSEDELAATLGAAGLASVRRLGPTWLLAAPLEDAA